MGKVSRDARLTFLLLFTLVDDSGTSRGNVAMLRRSLFPYDDVTQEQMDGWLSELADAKAIIRYQSAEGDNYIKIPKWAEHQKIDRASPSKLPQFDDNSTTIRRQFDESSRGLAVGLEGNGREWKGMEGNGSSAPARRLADKPPAVGPSPISEIRTSFLESFEKEFGRSYPGWGVKENGQAKAWLKSVSVETAKELCRLYPKWNDPWVTKQGHPFGILVAQYVQLDAWSKSHRILVDKIAKGRAVEAVDIKKAVQLEELDRGIQHTYESSRDRHDGSGKLPHKTSDGIPITSSDFL